ncbi:acyltransferase family protein [Moheibacter sediminis]|uniref:Peptidoglycan/LPS O-acetylase OafA/YrhL, contains acyltransferase and SGNH-hydrolase domains n=1 Tax=Moheibacter sediminis TaxID=1434700 RepID=A0A1W2AL29_9FLAO|nr:acyltransferase [Moheibacter sediminis]SMC61363.1 Peptidoglycan/LPS O-acetylase OafA/YrhL, contains acyltransferase and SGNH-hydrolase domains [Moheibacter sediminis]
MNSDKVNTAFFPALTGFRAIAAWMIFVYHFFPFKNESLPQIYKILADGFHIGVDMFFVLSGFLITYRYYEKINIDFNQYMLNRFARIYPMFFIITTLVYINTLFIRQDIPDNLSTELFLNYTLTKTIFFDYHLTGVKQAWTLTLEEMFYVIAPFLFILIKKNTMWLIIILSVIVFGGTVLHENFKNIGGTGGFLHQNIFLYFIEFFAGVTLALMLRKFKTNTKLFFTTFGSVMILFFLLTHRYLDRLELDDSLESFIKMIFLTLFGIMPLFWGLINEKNRIKDILSTKLFVLLGKSSYIFYLIHKGFIANYIKEDIWDNILFLFIVLNLFSILLFLYVEEPLNHKIRRKFRKKRQTILLTDEKPA